MLCPNKKGDISKCPLFYFIYCIVLNMTFTWKIPRIGTCKLYHMLHLPFIEGEKSCRDKLFNILRTNHLRIKSVRSYHITTNSHHWFRKHKNLVENMEATRSKCCNRTDRRSTQAGIPV